jgi:hypothetical protein
MRIITLLLLLSLCGTAYGELPEYYDSFRLCQAIFKAEGGDAATYLFGIRSIPYKDKDEARRICLNTINNNKVRFYKQDVYSDYLDFLGSRYCPTTGNLSKREREVNGNWLRMVRHFYNKSC